MMHVIIRFAAIAVLLATSRAAFADEPTVEIEKPASAQQTLTAFIDAFADADLERMGKFYADSVTVKMGSTLLDAEYGALGGDDGREKDQTVTRDALLTAYEKAIENLSGKENWVRKGRKLKTVDVKLITDESENADKIFAAIGAKKGDVFALVNPEGDTLFFHLRQIDGQWKVIAEAWD